MGLQAQIKSAIKSLFNALGDIVGPATYHQKSGASTYDEDAGQMVYPVVDYPLKKVAFVRFKQSETDKDPTLATDEKMIFQRAELPVVPDAADTVTDRAGVKWEVIQRLRDPIDGVVILRVRTN